MWWDSLDLIYTAGMYENENTYQLQDSSWNLANDYLIIDYSLPSAMNVTVRVYNYLGTEVLSSTKGRQSNGQYSLKLETSSLSAGIYMVKFERGNELIAKKIVVME